MNILKKILSRFFKSSKTKMEQEIMEQPDVIFELIRKYINKDYFINIELPAGINKIVLIGSGSSYNCAAIAAYFIKRKARINAEAYYSSEITIDSDFKTEAETLYIFISQSGETSDVNAAFNKISAFTENTLAVTNTKNSNLYKKAKYKILSSAGIEKAAAASKSMTAQLFCLILTGLKLMEMNKLNPRKYLDELLEVPEYIKNVFSIREDIKKAASVLAGFEHAAIAACGIFCCAAKEGALKIAETSYINISAYQTGEFLHGHIALLNRKCALIMLVNEQNLHPSIDVLTKIKNNFKTDIIIVSAVPVKNDDNNDFIRLNSKNNIDFLFSSIALFQLLALETALLLNKNPDAPEGLTKVVK